MTHANDSSVEWQEVHSQDRTDSGNFLPDPMRVRIRDSCFSLCQLRGQGACGFRTHHIHWGLETDYSPLFVTLPHGMPCGLMNIQAEAFDQLRSRELLYKSHSCHSQSDGPVAATRF